ncbi:hypothetical protein HOD29_01890 [archaeon]|jgi:hypothetical protein|nr:hypothetical protein [archaeon]
MKKKHFRFLSLAFFLVGIFFLLNSKTDITGAVVGVSNLSSGLGFIFGIVFILVSAMLFVGGESLEERLEEEHHWKKYPLNKDSIIQDVEQEYLNSQEEYKRSPIQERIERRVTGGKTIETPNKRKTYEEQFYEGHASQGGRVLDVQSHIAKKGEKKGRLMHFGQPANAKYLWVVDEDGNFIVANRQTFQHEMENMDKEKIDYRHRLHKLPHATLAKGKKIYGSGEVLIEGGLIKEVNTHSGHYLPVTITPGRNPGEYENSLIENFNHQGKEVFKEFSKKYGWREVKKGAKYD